MTATRTCSELGTMALTVGEWEPFGMTDAEARTFADALDHVGRRFVFHRLIDQRSPTLTVFGRRIVIIPDDWADL